MNEKSAAQEKLPYTLEWNYDGSEADILCACGGFLQRLSPQRLARLLDQAKKNSDSCISFRADCRKCKKPCEISFAYVLREVPTQNGRAQEAWKAVYERSFKQHVPDQTENSRQEQHWTERDLKLVCKGTPAKECSQDIATLELVSESQWETIRNTRWRNVKHSNFHQEFALDFRSLTSYQEEQHLLKIPCFIRYNLRFSPDYMLEVYEKLKIKEGVVATNLWGEDEVMSEVGRADAEDIILAGTCYVCGRPHILQGAERKQLMMRWLRKTEANLKRNLT